MPESPPVIAYCHSCGGAMNVTKVAPFSNVECPACGKHTRVKREFGPYTLLKRHAIGGMSVVFLAQDNTLGREVIVKILNEEYSADEKRITAFVEEARITASFSHPHVVRVFTTGRAFERFYIAMELVAGGHLEHQIRERGTIPEREMLPLAIQVAEGLKAAHAAGLIHRDIKPGNILLDAEGNAKIVDFGLALVTKGGTATAQEIWATPYYVPPETIEGHAEDFRSDVYAFGAMLYHALAGKPPCDEESMATHVLREAKKKVQPLCTAASWLSPDTCAVVDKAMAYRPEDRFSSYEEMISRLQMALQRVQSGANAESEPAQHPRRQTKKRERLLFIGGGLGLLAVVGLASWLIMRGGEEVLDEPGPVVEQPAQEKEPDAPPEDPAAAARIGRIYREARAAVAAADYEAARTAFVALREDTKVQEPTRTWAAVEAVLVAFLDGKSAEARLEAEAAAAHLASADDGDPRMKEKLAPVLEKLSALPAIVPDSPDPAGADASDAAAWMLAALKNWDQGKLAEAALLFEAVAGIGLSAGDAWISVYQDLARNYLADYTALSAPVFEMLPDDKSSCEAAIDELNTVLASLKTRGRARFNVRAWQLELTRHSRRLDQVPEPEPEPEPAPPTVDEILGSIVKLGGEGRFADAVAYLKGLPDGVDKAARDSLLALTESAVAFLGDLEDDLQRGASQVGITLKSGESYTSVSLTGPGKLALVDGNGNRKECTWGDLEPDSVINLYRALVRRSQSELERLRRHESAIAFDWLMGDRERAAAAADRLAKESPVFKKRWEEISSGLPG